MNKGRDSSQAKSAMPATSWWQKRSLFTKIATLSVVVSFTVCLFSLGFILSSYKSEKIAHLFELHANQTASLASLTGALLGTQVLNSKNPQKVQPQSTSSEADRDPIEGEFFWTKIGAKSSILFKVSAGLFEIPFNPSQLAKGLASYQDLPYAIVNPLGQALGSNLLNAKQVSELLEHAMKSGLSKSQSVVDIWGERRVLSYAELENTNLVLISARPVGDIMRPVRNKIWLWVFLCSCLFLGGAFAQRIVILALSKPLRELTHFFDEIVANKLPPQVQTTIPELSSVMGGAQIMMRAIDTRQKRLNFIIEGQGRILQFTQQAQHLESLEEQCILFVNLMNDLNPRAKPYCWRLTTSDKTQAWFDFEVGMTFLTAHPNTQDLKDDLNNYLDNISILTDQKKAVKILDLESFKPDIPLGIFIDFEEFRKEKFDLFIGFKIKSTIEKQGLMHSTEFVELVNLAADGFRSCLIRRSLSTLQVADKIAKREMDYAKTVHEKCIYVDTNLPKNIHISTLVKPASVVGGDWLAVYGHSQIGLVNFYIGDVTGHGLDSAFLVSLVSGAVKMAERELELGHLALPPKPSFLATKYLADLYANLDMLMRDSTESKQMTFAAGIIDTHKGILYFLSAGHPPPMRFYQSPNAGYKSLMSVQNGPLGSGSASDDVEIRIEELESGETLFLYSDGLFENLAPSDRPNHKTRYKAIRDLITGQSHNIVDLAKNVFDWSKSLSRKEESLSDLNEIDDVTILAIRYEKLP